jgi:hypothetical protein
MRCACGCGKNLSWKNGRIAQHAVDLREAYPYVQVAIELAQAEGVVPDPSFERLLQRGRAMELSMLLYAHGEVGAEVLLPMSSLDAWRREATAAARRVSQHVQDVQAWATH